MKEMKLTSVAQTFESIFDDMGVDASHEASLYYAASIYYTPVSFTEMYRKARSIRKTISERALKNGRNALLDNGLIARVLFVHESDTSFGTEPYLPVNPKIVADVHNDYLKETYSDEDFSIRNRDIEELSRVWVEHFGRSGTKIKEGSITLQYDDMWVICNLLGSMDGSDSIAISMMLGGIGIFKEVYDVYYNHIIQQGSTIRAIIDINEEVEDIKRLKMKYGDKIEIKYIPNEYYGTCRHIIFGQDWALDGKNILLSDQSGPSSISTIYMRDQNSIDVLRNNFEDMWIRSLSKSRPKNALKPTSGRT